MYQQFNGFTILEILLACALLSLVYMPVLSILQMLSTRESVLVYTQFENYKSKGISGVSSVNVSNSDSVVCADFDGYISMELYSSEELGIGTTTKITQVKSIGGDLVLGLDSSEVSDPDIAILSTTNMHMVSKLHISPGVTDMTISGTRVYVTQSGVAADVTVATLYPSISVEKNCTLKADRRDGRKATTIQVIGKNIVVGFEKNNGPELFLLDSNCNILDTKEYGFGVHDTYMVSNLIYVLGPSNPELLVYRIDDSRLIEVGTLDLPGDSGNGRSFDYMASGFVLGRSRGNEELVYLDKGLHVLDSIKVGSSVDTVISGTSTVHILTSHPDKELQIFKGTSLIRSVDLPSRTRSATCTGNKMYIGTDATSTALIVIHSI